MANCSFYAQKWLMSDFGCDTVFLPKNLSSLSAHALIRHQHHDLRCFLSLSFVWFPGVKTKKPVGLTGVFFITFAHPYSRLFLHSLGKGGRELLHGRRKPTSSQATARSDFTSKAKRRFEWRAAVAAWRCEDIMRDTRGLSFFMSENKKMVCLLIKTDLC